MITHLNYYQTRSQSFQKGGVELACMLVRDMHVQDPPLCKEPKIVHKKIE